MAKVTVNPKNVTPPMIQDAWDEYSKFSLELTREEAKVVYTVLCNVAKGASGQAGVAAANVYNAIGAIDGRLFGENNLYVVNYPTLVIKSK